jgi:hypothetical protein
MTGMYSSAGALTAICLTLLVGAPGRTGQLLAAVLSLLLLVHSRGMGARWHRVAMLLPGLYGAGLVSLWLGATLPDSSRPLVVGGVLLGCAGLTIAALIVPGRRMLPYWGRAADIVHSLLAVAVVPVLLLDLGVYHILRGLAG